MGLFSPKYPKSDTAGATGTPAPRESRADRRHRETREARDRDLADRFKAAERAGKERSARFWSDYEQRNGAGSVDWA
ncbi:hypothetical protein [Streptomyces cadmiisoli]|uniref:hypothetical protein n=1 Tax=Streptomyces cadmiisoli TaxID=2184053 RepID=UPI0036469A1F